MQCNLTAQHPGSRTKERQTTCLTGIANIAELATQTFFFLLEKKEEKKKFKTESSVQEQSTQIPGSPLYLQDTTPCHWSP